MRVIAYGITLITLVICLAHLVQPHALFGIVEYDDGVYVAASVSFLNGKVPYRDFAFGHPPGVILLLAPIAFLTQTSGTRATLATARLLTVLVAAANVFLVTRLVRHRGTAALVVSGLFLAFFPASVFATTTVMLEPYAVLFCLLACSFMFAGDEIAGRERLVAAGIAFGLAGTIKVWALLPAVVAAACCAPHFRRRMGPLILGMTTGFVLPSIVFFSVAPSAFIRDVVTVQLTREASPGAFSVGERLVYLTGIPSFPSIPLAAAAAGVYAVVVAVGLIVKPRPTRLDWFALGSTATTACALLAAPDFGFHYAYFFAAFLALLLGLCCGRLMAAAASSKPLWLKGFHAQPRTVRAALAVLASALIVAAGIRSATWHPAAYDPPQALAATVPKGACLITDQPALAIAADRFVSSSGRCPTVVDPFFTWLVSDPANPPSPTASPPRELVERWGVWVTAADYVVVSSDPFRIPWPTLRARFGGQWQHSSSDGITIYRTGHE